eukprot:jgi/Bigna1/126229/aug1.2_g937
MAATAAEHRTRPGSLLVALFVSLGLLFFVGRGPGDLLGGEGGRRDANDGRYVIRRAGGPHLKANFARVHRRGALPPKLLFGGGDGSNGDNCESGGERQEGRAEQTESSIPTAPGEVETRKVEEEEEGPFGTASSDTIQALAQQLKEELQLGEEAEDLIRNNKKEELAALIRSQRQKLITGELKNEHNGDKNVNEGGSATKSPPLSSKPSSLKSYDICDEGGDRREMVSGQMASEFVETIRDEPENFKSVKLSGKSLGAEAAGVFAEVFKKCSNLKTVDLSDCIAGRQEDDAHDALEILADSVENHTLIENVWLNDNALGDNGIRRVRHLLQNRPNLQELGLANTGMQRPAVQLVKEMVLNASNPSKLRVIEMHKNLLTTEGTKELAELVSHSPKLEVLTIRQSRVTEEGAEALFKGLLSTTLLKELDFRYNNIGDTTIELLAAVIAQQTDLQAIRIGGTNIRGKLFPRINGVITATASQLKEYAVSDTSISGDETGDFLHRISALKNLEILNMEENTLRTGGAKTLAAFIANGTFPKLKVLNVKDNMISSAGALEISKAVCKLRGFERLEMDFNYLSEWVIAEIEKIFADAKMPDSCLGELDFNDPEMDEDDVDDGGGGGEAADNQDGKGGEEDEGEKSADSPAEQGGGEDSGEDEAVMREFEQMALNGSFIGGANQPNPNFN